MLKVLEARYLLISIGALITILLFYATSRQYGDDIVYGLKSQTSKIWSPRPASGLYGPELAREHLTEGQSNNVDDIFNETLGFQQIRMIAMPDRTDQRDGFSVAASIHGLEYIQDDGVDGSSISDKAIPYTMDVKPAILGCWRAHANVWQDIVHRDITSALIMEGDSDWDVGLRAQMLEFAKGSRYVLDEQDKNTFSPYGDDWDLLWLGHCGSAPAPWSDKRYFIPHDPTVPPIEGRITYGVPDMSRWEADGPINRIVYPAYAGTCTAAYAISHRGARKALYRLSMQPNNYAVDIGIRVLCMDKAFGFKCVAPFPTIIGMYRPAGNQSQFSDIEDYDGVQEEGEANGLVFSTRNNVDRFMKGEKMFRSGFPDEIQEMSIEDLTRAVGRPETARIKEQYQGLSDEDYKQIPWESEDGRIE